MLHPTTNSTVPPPPPPKKPSVFSTERTSQKRCLLSPYYALHTFTGQDARFSAPVPGVLAFSGYYHAFYTFIGQNERFSAPGPGVFAFSGISFRHDAPTIEYFGPGGGSLSLTIAVIGPGLFGGILPTLTYKQAHTQQCSKTISYYNTIGRA